MTPWKTRNRELDSELAGGDYGRRRTIGVFLPNWLGDLVTSTPLLRALRHRYAESRVVGIMRPYLSQVLQNTGLVDEQWYWEPRSARPEWRTWPLVQRLRSARFDCVFILPHSLRPALVAALGGARERVGYVRNGRGPFLTRKVFPLRRDGQLVDRPLVDHFLDLAAAVGCSVESRRLELATTDKDELSAERVWHNLGLRVDGRVAILNSGSANGVARFWPKEYFAELARRLVDRLDHDVLVLCGPMERQLARDIVRQAGRTRVRSMAAQPLDIGTAKACIRRGRFMVSTDSGPRHLAAAFGKPVITLRGPTLPIWSENPTVQAIDLRVELDCIGCRRSVCPRGDHRCMSALSVDLVYKKVVELIDRTSPALETEPKLLRYPRRRAVAHRRAA